MKKDSYAVLKVPKGATLKEIKLAYNKLAQEHHPDKTGGDERSANIFAEATEAYKALSDPVKRNKYDEAQSKELVTNLNQTVVQIVEEYFSQFIRS